MVLHIHSMSFVLNMYFGEFRVGVSLFFEFNKST
jgi:hypothetical protein